MRKETLPSITNYIVRYLTLADNISVQDLCERCAKYSEHAMGNRQEPIGAQSIFTELPPGKTYNDKLLIGIYQLEDKLIGILSAVRDYPEPETWYLGLLMLDPQESRQGLEDKIYQMFEQWANARGAASILINPALVKAERG